MAEIRGVVFDLGGVVVEWDPMHLYRNVFRGEEAKAADFLAHICTPAWNEKQDAGRPLDEAAAELVARHPEWEAEIRAYYDRWIEMIGGPVPGTREVMAELKAAGVRLFALSNWSAETFPRIAERFEELAMFEQIVLSGEHGCVKPEARLFRIAIERFAVPVRELVFVDDSLRNVAGAEAVGLRALLFRDAAKLRSDLAALGLPLGA